MSLRLRRLTNEYKRLEQLFGGNKFVSVRATTGDPPHAYRVEYRIAGLERLPDGTLVVRRRHDMEIVLPVEYPRMPAACRMLTPVFHPNIDTFTVCTSDFHAAQETLVDLIVRVGQMIAFQKHNVKSPLNSEAAIWCEQNASKLPVDASDLYPPELGNAASDVTDVKNTTQQVKSSSLPTISQPLPPLNKVPMVQVKSPPPPPFSRPPKSPTIQLAPGENLLNNHNKATGGPQSKLQPLSNIQQPVTAESGTLPEVDQLVVESIPMTSTNAEETVRSTLYPGEITMVGANRMTICMKHFPPLCLIRIIGRGEFIKLKPDAPTVFSSDGFRLTVHGASETSVARLGISPLTWNRSHPAFKRYWNGVFATEALIIERVTAEMNYGGSFDSETLEKVVQKLQSCNNKLNHPDTGIVGQKWRARLQAAVYALSQVSNRARGSRGK